MGFSSQKMVPKKVMDKLEKGGLGIRDLGKFNLALLGKWRWNLFNHHGELWAQVLESKFGGWRNLDATRRSIRESLWWRDLGYACNLSEKGSWLKNGTKWKVGCGSKVLFWEDGWMEDGVSLKEKYPRLYQISQQQNRHIQQMGTITDTGWEWKLQWKRFFLEAEIDTAAKFMKHLHRLTIHVQQQDMCRWEGDSSGKYTMGSAYELLNRNFPLESLDEMFKALWEIKVPSKATIFAWILIRERLPTKSNLRRRNVETNDVTCPFCRSHDEDKAHLFFT
ncbi:putative ribonuclease H protein [Glycine soja]